MPDYKKIPLDLCLLNMIFQEKRGLTHINDKAMETLIISFSQRERLFQELAQ